MGHLTKRVKGATSVEGGEAPAHHLWVVGPWGGSRIGVRASKTLYLSSVYGDYTESSLEKKQ